MPEQLSKFTPENPSYKLVYNLPQIVDSNMGTSNLGSQTNIAEIHAREHEQILKLVECLWPGMCES